MATTASMATSKEGTAGPLTTPRPVHCMPAWLALEGAQDTADAIRRLAVRGAPLIGVAAAYGLAMEVAAQPGLGALERGWETLRAARPTAVNLAHAVDRVRAAALAAGPTTM